MNRVSTYTGLEGGGGGGGWELPAGIPNVTNTKNPELPKSENSLEIDFLVVFNRGE